MPKILLIDDEPQLRDLLSKILVHNNFEVILAEDGASGLRKAKLTRPDLIILDIIMPGMDGFEVVQRLHDDPFCSRIPIMILTALATSYARETALEAGADDFVTKPFQLEDVVARARSMTSKSHSSPNSMTKPLENIKKSRLISVHSLRGGLGCTTLAINLASILHSLWQRPTLLMDCDFAGGQIAMALRLSQVLSWSELQRSNADDSIHRTLDEETIVQEGGLHLLAAPRDPDHADRFSPPLVGHALKLLEHRYEYMVADLAHDFRGNTQEILKNSDMILYLLSPESISIQLTKKALETYATLGIKNHNLGLILVDTRPNMTDKVSDIEQAIGHPLSAYIPYAAEITSAIDRGMPFVKAFPDHSISSLAKDLSYLMSRPEHKDPTQEKSHLPYQQSQPQLSVGGQNGHGHSNGRSLLKRMGLWK